MSLPYKLKFHPKFIPELEVAIRYYEGQSVSAASKFRSAAKKQLNLIKKNPLTQTIRFDDIRFARLEQFPYAIHYSIDKINRWVLIHSLSSDYQDPRSNWQRRF